MKKTTDVICLVIWIMQLVFGIWCFVNNKPASTVAFICATAICVMHYLDELFG